MPLEDIPQELQEQLARQQKAKALLIARRARAQQELDKLTAEYTASQDAGPDASALRKKVHAKRRALRRLQQELADVQDSLKKTLREFQKYEPAFTGYSNVAGDPSHLRMPSTRSSLSPQAIRLPRRDDS